MTIIQLINGQSSYKNSGFRTREKRDELSLQIEDEVMTMYQDMFTMPGSLLTAPVSVQLDKEIELDGNIVAFIFNVHVA